MTAVVQQTEDVTIRYDSVYLTCSKKLTGSQLSLPHVSDRRGLLSFSVASQLQTLRGGNVPPGDIPPPKFRPNRIGPGIRVIDSFKKSAPRESAIGSGAGVSASFRIFSRA